MIRSRNKPASSAFIASTKDAAAAAVAGKAEEGEWEVRPGGMLVQKRSPDSESAVTAAAAGAVHAIRVKVKHESAYYEIYLSSQSTFGALKRLVAERTGVHHHDQKLLYRDKERESAAYLDACGVRDKSKLVMVVDPTAHARRLLEARRAARLERASRAVKDVAAVVDRLAVQVTDMEATIAKGKKVVDKDILNLTEQLMTQLIKLDGIVADGIVADGIVADGDIKLQRGMQVRRIQKHVEALDALKIKNAKIATAPLPLRHRQQPTASVVVTTEWEMFDSSFTPSASTTTSTSTSSSSIAPAHHWQLL